MKSLRTGFPGVLATAEGRNDFGFQPRGVIYSVIYRLDKKSRRPPTSSINSCNRLAVAPTLLDASLSWLAIRTCCSIVDGHRIHRCPALAQRAGWPQRTLA